MISKDSIFVETAINFWTREIELRVDKRGDPVCFRSVAITRAEGGGGESGSASGKRRRWKTRVVFSAREITIRPRGRREERLSVSEAETPRGFAKALGFPPTPVHCCTPPRIHGIAGGADFPGIGREFASRRGICVGPSDEFSTGSSYLDRVSDRRRVLRATNRAIVHAFGGGDDLGSALPRYRLFSIFEFDEIGTINADLFDTRRIGGWDDYIVLRRWDRSLVKNIKTCSNE